MPSAISEVQAVRADLRAAAAAVQELSDCGEASEGLCPIRERRSRLNDTLDISGCFIENFQFVATQNRRLASKNLLAVFVETDVPPRLSY